MNFFIKKIKKLLTVLKNIVLLPAKSKKMFFIENDIVK